MDWLSWLFWPPRATEEQVAQARYQQEGSNHKLAVLYRETLAAEARTEAEIMSAPTVTAGDRQRKREMIKALGVVRNLQHSIEPLHRNDLGYRYKADTLPRPTDPHLREYQQESLRVPTRGFSGPPSGYGNIVGSNPSPGYNDNARSPPRVRPYPGASAHAGREQVRAENYSADDAQKVFNSRVRAEPTLNKETKRILGNEFGVGYTDEERPATLDQLSTLSLVRMLQFCNGIGKDVTDVLSKRSAAPANNDRSKARAASGRSFRNKTNSSYVRQQEDFPADVPHHLRRLSPAPRASIYEAGKEADEEFEAQWKARERARTLAESRARESVEAMPAFRRSNSYTTTARELSHTSAYDPDTTLIEPTQAETQNSRSAKSGAVSEAAEEAIHPEFTKEFWRKRRFTNDFIEDLKKTGRYDEFVREAATAVEPVKWEPVKMEPLKLKSNDATSSAPPPPAPAATLHPYPSTSPLQIPDIFQEFPGLRKWRERALTESYQKDFAEMKARQPTAAASTALASASASAGSEQPATGNIPTPYPPTRGNRAYTSEGPREFFDGLRARSLLSSHQLLINPVSIEEGKEEGKESKPNTDSSGAESTAKDKMKTFTDEAHALLYPPSHPHPMPQPPPSPPALAAAPPLKRAPSPLVASTTPDSFAGSDDEDEMAPDKTLSSGAAGFVSTKETGTGIESGISVRDVGSAATPPAPSGTVTTAPTVPSRTIAPAPSSSSPRVGMLAQVLMRTQSDYGSGGGGISVTSTIGGSVSNSSPARGSGMRGGLLRSRSAPGNGGVSRENSPARSVRFAMESPLMGTPMGIQAGKMGSGGSEPSFSPRVGFGVGLASLDEEDFEEEGGFEVE